MTAAEAILTPTPPHWRSPLGIAGWLARGLAGLRELGPYAAIELVLPGGSLLALLLWLYRRHKRQASLSSGRSAIM